MKHVKALILAAGLGTRLYPLTKDKPKALVEINGKTLLQRAIEKLKQHKVSEITVNVHAFGEQIIDFLHTHSFDIPIHISDEREELLDTGGAILKAAPFLSDSDAFIVYNVDVISDINLDKMLKTHLATNALSTLAVRKRTSSRYLLFNSENQLKGWKNIKSGEQIILSDEKKEEYAFSGIHILNPSIFDLIQQKGKFSIIPSYLQLAKEHSIFGFEHTDDLWMDMGKYEDFGDYQKLLSTMTNG